ncbi:MULTISPECIES: RNA polymerase sigma factor [unclassified Spirosoma]|uniref:RNA polymerase sigma factor n=1 Tax=unclassified Spirosoma TaxID=2621999 RepID=UPI000A72C8C9|nr:MULTISPECIES: RNA polymerase sigma factor [unclassified Spirosoma]MBN8826849.1 RNA polymerase sigma factor [Spirosoma sp.]
MKSNQFSSLFARSEGANTLALSSFDDIYLQYIEKVYQKCLTMTNNPITAQDYTQDIFIKVFLKLDSFKQRSDIYTWLYSITHNYCVDQLRMEKRKKHQLFALEGGMDYSEGESSTLDDKLTILDQLIDNLPESDQQMLRLHYQQGVRLEAIARQMNLKLSAVKMRLLRNRRAIYKKYQQVVGNMDYVDQ